MAKLIVNTLLFQLGWFACVFGGDSLWLLIVAAVLAVHLLWTSSWAAEGKLLVSVFIAGSALDSFLLNLGVFDFGEPRTLDSAVARLPVAVAGDHAQSLPGLDRAAVVARQRAGGRRRTAVLLRRRTDCRRRPALRHLAESVADQCHLGGGDARDCTASPSFIAASMNNACASASA